MSELQGLLSRLWSDLIARPGGPLEFRFLLQPLIAAWFTVRDGMAEACTGRSPYFWTLAHDPARRRRGGLHGEADPTQHPRHLGR
jgi:hypothetical protein